MTLRANTPCFYLDQNGHVIEAITVDDEQKDGSISIKFSTAFTPKVVRAMSVFRTKIAADRAAAVLVAARSKGSGDSGSKFNK